MTASTAMPDRLQVCVLGLGYIGLPTAAILASRGHRVHGVDVNPIIVKTINDGRIHIVEPELDLIVRAAVESGRLHADCFPAPSDVFMICVPTPVDHGTRDPDLSFVEVAAHSIAPVIRPGNLVVLESTSPPGTTAGIVADTLRAGGLNPGTDFHLAYCPERVLPGAILRESVENDRVIGGFTPRCAEAARRFYATFVQGELHATDCTTAEIVKLAENASRDVQIAFANELSLLARRHGVSVWDVIRMANRHPRVNILQPGPGVGGHCIAVDPWFLVSGAGDDASLLRAARARNDSMPGHTARLIADASAAAGAGTVALLGMSYKPDIDDCRESPSLDVYMLLREQAPELDVLCCEPNVRELPGITLASLDECVKRAGVIAVLVAHREFREYPWQTLPPDTKLLDFRGITASPR